MQMRLFPALILFLSSYFPLSLILLIQDVKETSWQAPLCRIMEFSSCYFPGFANPGRALGMLGICAASLIIFMTLMKNLSGYSALEVIDSKSIPK
jgi:hypothetical protein